VKYTVIWEQKRAKRVTMSGPHHRQVTATKERNENQHKVHEFPTVL